MVGVVGLDSSGWDDVMRSYEHSPQRKRRQQKRRQREEKQWAAKAGPVVTMRPGEKNQDQEPAQGQEDPKESGS